MTRLYQLVFILLTVQTCLKAAPSDISKLEDIAKIERAEELKDELTSPTLLDDVAEDDNVTTQGQRQKRWYDFYGYGYPPMNPIAYPTYSKRDESFNMGGYGPEDPISLIYRRLMEISAFGRQQNLPVAQPPLPQIPIFFPVLYIPQIGCGCTPQSPSPTDNNGTTPSITNRFPAMEDTRQNWGFLINETDNKENEEDSTRPIMFDPIPPRRNMGRRPPPVEHGSTQSDINSQSPSQAGTINRQPSPPNASSPSPVSAPSVCDTAILSCCHQPKITYDCFSSQGCPDTSSYGNPCAPNILLNVVKRFQDYYAQRVDRT